MSDKRLAALASMVSLSDEISRPTEIKEPAQAVVETLSEKTEALQSILSKVEDVHLPEPDLNPPAPIHQQIQPPVEEEEEYDAEKEARSLVYTLTAIDQFVLNIAVLLKCRSSVGGSKGIAKMKSAITKEFAGEELTEEDKKLIARMKEYKSNMEALSGEMIVKPSEMNRLIEVATSWCEETKFKVGSGTAFWANYVGSLAERTTKIIMN